MREFLVVLRRKADLLEAVLELTRKQSDYFSGEEVTDELLTNISQRQTLIDQIDALTHEVPDRKEMAENPECVELSSKITGLLKEIQKQDKKNEALALEKMEELKQKLKRGRDGVKAVRGYGNTNNNNSVFFNKKR